MTTSVLLALFVTTQIPLRTFFPSTGDPLPAPFDGFGEVDGNTTPSLTADGRACVRVHTAPSSLELGLCALRAPGVYDLVLHEGDAIPGLVPAEAMISLGGIQPGGFFAMNDAGAVAYIVNGAVVVSEPSGASGVATRVIARTGDLPPIGTRPYASMFFHPQLNGSGDVAFMDADPAGGGTNKRVWLYIAGLDSLTLIASTDGEVSPGIPGLVTSIETFALTELGTVIFFGGASDAFHIVYEASPVGARALFRTPEPPPAFGLRDIEGIAVSATGHVWARGVTYDSVNATVSSSHHADPSGDFTEVDRDGAGQGSDVAVADAFFPDDGGNAYGLSRVVMYDGNGSVIGSTAQGVYRFTTLGAATPEVTTDTEAFPGVLVTNVSGLGVDRSGIGWATTTIDNPAPADDATFRINLGLFSVVQSGPGLALIDGVETALTTPLAAGGIPLGRFNAVAGEAVFHTGPRLLGTAQPPQFPDLVPTVDPLAVGPIFATAPFTLTFSVSNFGAVASTGARLVLTADAPVTYSGSPTVGGCTVEVTGAVSFANATCQVPGVAAGADTVFDLPGFSVATAGAVTFTASLDNISPAQQSTVNDVDTLLIDVQPAEGEGEGEGEGEAGEGEGEGGLRNLVVRIVAEGPLVVGNAQNLVMTVENVGLEPLDVVELAFQITGGRARLGSLLAFPTCQATQPDGEVNERVDCNAGTLASGASFSVTLPVTPEAATGGAPAQLDVVVTGQTATPDEDPAGNTAEATFPFETTGADVSISKQRSNHSEGGFTRHFFVVRNTGPDRAVGVQVTMPDGLDADGLDLFEDEEDDGCTPGLCRLSALDVGAEARFAAEIADDETVEFTVSADTPDPNLKNNAVTVHPADGCGCAATTLPPTGVLALALLALSRARSRFRRRAPPAA